MDYAFAYLEKLRARFSLWSVYDRNLVLEQRSALNLGGSRNGIWTNGIDEWKWDNLLDFEMGKRTALGLEMAERSFGHHCKYFLLSF